MLVTTKLKEHSLNKMIQRNRLLMQQAELLSSLAMKVDIENTDQSLESAWKILQDFLQQTKDGDTLKFQLPKMNFEPDSRFKKQ
uniref:Myb-like DNA-binding protein n=2 Tax=Solanum tuberosum TaxID=4113 RepID=M1BQR1_SOLTU